MEANQTGKAESGSARGDSLVVSAPLPAVGATQCWWSTGVFGDNTCPELSRHVHCRNCPSFATATLSLLRRPQPVGYAREKAVQYSHPKRHSEIESVLVLLVRCQNRWLAMPTSGLREVTDRRPIHSLPFRDHGPLLGLANVRGELVPCFSLGRLLGSAEIPSPDEQRSHYRRLVIVTVEAFSFGLPVQEVPEPHRVNRSVCAKAPLEEAGASALVRGSFNKDGRAIGLLDLEALARAARASMT